METVETARSRRTPPSDVPTRLYPSHTPLNGHRAPSVGHGGGPGRGIDPERRWSQAKARPARKATSFGLGLSLLLHLAVLVTLGRVDITPRRVIEDPPGVIEDLSSGLHVITLQPVPTEPLSEPVVPMRVGSPGAHEPAGDPAASLLPEPGIPEQPTSGLRKTSTAYDETAAERLAPRLGDPRLWRPLVRLPHEPTLADVQARVGAAVELLSDSALADAERRMAALDWTIMDQNGGKWGVSPGKLHLGKLTIPLPIYFAEEHDPARSEWLEVQAQADRTLFLESFDDRVRKIRERRDRERAERQEQGAVVAGSGSLR